jgi:general secretion pathway protein L
MARFLGIDIDDNALRGVLVRSTLRKIELDRYIEIPLTAAPDSPGRMPELAEAGRNLLRALSVGPDAIIGGVAGEETSLRVLELPAAARKRIAEVLPFELETLLPYDPHDAIVDFQPIASAEGVLRVLTAAVLRPHVAATIERMRHAGLEPRELAAGAAALDGLSNLLPELKVPGPVVVVDLSEQRTDLCFLQSGHCVNARTLDFGIAAMPKAADALRHELQRTLASFRGAGFDTPLAIYLCGEGARAEGASAWISEALGQAVQLLELPQPTNPQTAPSPVFGRAAALAARAAAGGRRINLRSGEFAHRQTGSQLMQHVNMIAICAVVVVMTAMFSLKAQQKLLADEQTALRAELTTVTSAVLGEAISDPMLAEARVKNPRLTDPLPRFDAFDALAVVSGSIKPEITHEVRRLMIEVADEKRDGRMELQGALDSLSQRDEIVSQLEHHPCFHDIELGRTTPAGSGNRINYQIEAVVQCAGEGPDKDKKKSAPKKEETE